MAGHLCAVVIGCLLVGAFAQDGGKDSKDGSMLLLFLLLLFFLVVVVVVVVFH